MELLAREWATTDQFRVHLYSSPPSDVFADNNPQTYVLTTGRLNATKVCLIGELADFKFRIHCSPGESSGDADALSIISLKTTKYIYSCTEELPRRDQCGC